MAEEALIVKDLGGVGMTVRVAGPGTRSYAFVTDWLLRTLLALGCLLAGALLALQPAMADHPRTAHHWMAGGVVLALLSYFLYHPVLEVAMRGRTPGLSKAGARIVTVDGAIPGTGPLLIRNLLRLIDALPLFYVVGLACCLLTRRRVRLGDLAAGTVLVLDEAHPASGLGRQRATPRHTALPLDALRLIDDLLRRWRSLEETRRIRLARDLLCRLDPGFDPRQGEALSGPALRGRLRALRSGQARP